MLSDVYYPPDQDEKIHSPASAAVYTKSVHSSERTRGLGAHMLVVGCCSSLITAACEQSRLPVVDALLLGKMKRNERTTLLNKYANAS